MINDTKIDTQQKKIQFIRKKQVVFQGIHTVFDFDEFRIKQLSIFFFEFSSRGLFWNKRLLSGHLFLINMVTCRMYMYISL